MTERFSDEMPQHFDQSNALAVTEVIANLVRRVAHIDDIIEGLAFRAYPTALSARQAAMAQEEAFRIFAETQQLLSRFPSDPSMIPLHTLRKELERYFAEEIDPHVSASEASSSQSGVADVDLDAPSEIQR